MWESKFIFAYHMGIAPSEVDRWPIWVRKWMVERFVDQKQKENDAIKREQRKAQAKG